MPEGVIVALITVVIGGLFSLLLRWVDRKADRAKEAVAQNTADVENMNTTLQAMKLLLDSERESADRERKRDEERIKTLEKDLIEEKSINLALEKEVLKLKRKERDEPHG